jgi:hypothetical protein
MVVLSDSGEGPFVGVGAEPLADRLARLALSRPGSADLVVPADRIGEPGSERITRCRPTGATSTGSDERRRSKEPSP